MELTQLKTGAIADDAVTTDKLANAINTERTANTAKTTNATHTGDVTGATGLTIADNAVTLAKMAGGTDGQIITYDASGDPIAVGPGTDGQVLTSTGAGSPPAFEAIPASGKVLQVISTKTTTASSTSNAAAGEYYPLTSDAITVASGSTLYVFANYHYWAQEVDANIIYGRQGLEYEIGASGSWSTLRNAGAYESYTVATVNAGGGSPSVYPNQLADIASLNGILTHGQSAGTTIKVRIRHNHQHPNPVDLLVFQRTSIESNIIIYEVAA